MRVGVRAAGVQVGWGATASATEVIGMGGDRNGAFVQAKGATAAQRQPAVAAWRVGLVWSELNVFSRETGIPEFYVNSSRF